MKLLTLLATLVGMRKAQTVYVRQQMVSPTPHGQIQFPFGDRYVDGDVHTKNMYYHLDFNW